MIQKILNRLKKEWRKTPLGRTKKNDNPLRWGIIGLGYMAETFSCAIDGSKDDVVYVYYQVGEFYYVQVATTGKKGFAYASYISAEKSVPTK